MAGPRFPSERQMDLKHKGEPDRSKINMDEDLEVKYWLKEFGVSIEKLQQVVDKVGNSAATVRKELSA
jgi:Protein of unknown function (DUF3606)